MTDIVERLRYGDPMLCARQAADELEKLHDLLGKANALARIRWGEIERLKDERDAAIKEVAKWSREAGASQAREAKLREALEGLVSWVYASAHWGCTPLKVIYAQAVLALPTDDTALQEAIKQGQREVLMEAAEWFNEGDPAWYRLKEMAEEL